MPVIFYDYLHTEFHRKTSINIGVQEAIEHGLNEVRKIHSANHQHDRLMLGAEICLQCNRENCPGNCNKYKKAIKELKKQQRESKAVKRRK